MTNYTVDDYRAAAQRAKAAGNVEAAKELARRGIALQNNPQGTGVGRAAQRGYHGIIAGGNQFIGKLQANRVQNFTASEDETFRRALNLGLKQDVMTPLAPETQGMSQEQILNYYASERGYGAKWRDRVTELVMMAERKKENYRESGELAEDEAAIAKTAERIRARLKKIDDLPYSPAAQEGLKIFADAEGVVDWAAKSFKNPLESLAFIGEVAAESIPSVAAGAATSVLTGNPVAGAGVMIMASAPREYGGEVGAFLAENGVDLTDPKAIADALKNPELMDQAHANGLTKAAITSAFEALGMRAGGGFLRQTMAQAGTGGAGEAASQVAIEGEITSGKDIALEAVAELATTPGEAVIRSGSLFKKNGDVDPEALEGNAAAGSVARRLQRIAQSNGYNLKDVDRGGGAMNALENTRNEVVGEIDALKTALKKRLKPNKHTELSELLNVFAQAQTGIKQGKNKVATKVTKENFDALKTLVGDTQEGQLLLQKLQESNVITDLFQNGLKGGISQYTDYFNPLSSSGSIYDPGRGANIATSVLTGGGLFATGGPAALGAQAAGVVGGRAVDALTGRRSKINRFTNAYVKEQPFSPPTAPSIADIEAQTEMAETAQKRQRQEEIAALKDKLGAPDNDASPIGKMLLGTGLDRAGLKATLSELKDATEGSYVGEMAQSALDNLNGDTNRVSELSELIAITNAYLNKNNLADRRVAQPDSLLAQRDLLSLSSRAEQEGGAASVASSPNYQRGIVANQAMAARLKNDMLSDMDITARDKALLEVTMEALAQPLSNPVPSIDYMIESLKNDGVDEAAIDTYVKPYRERVQMQQMRNMSAPKFENPEISFEDAMASIDMDAPAQPALSEVLNQPSETELDTDPPALSQPKEAPQEAQQETLAAPVLQQPKVSTPPVLSAVKEEAPPVRALFNIGEPGGEFENGIQDLETAAKLSAALGQTVELFRNYEDMLSVAGHKVDKNRNIRGLFRSSQKGASGRVFGLLPGAQLPSGQKITSIDALSTFLHEASHGIAKGSFDGSNQYTSAALMSNNNWEAVIDGIINDRTDATKATVRDEIIDLQENRDVATVLNPEEKRSVRATREKMAQKEQLRSMMQQEGAPSDVIDARMQEIDMKYMRPYRAYYQQRSEFAVDPLWVYLINPKLAKKLMPETTKLIAENFRAAKNPKLQFYAHPIGVAVAAMMAMLFQGEEDEQERFVA